MEKQPALKKMLSHSQENVGFLFAKEDLSEVRDMLLANKASAAARAAAIAPCEVTVLAQNTGLGPEKISFFQALGITIKISRSTIEILSDARLIKTGDKVGASKATLQNISPVSFELIIQQVLDNGSICNPNCLTLPRKLHIPAFWRVSTMCRVFVCCWLPDCSISAPFCPQWYQQVLALSVESHHTLHLLKSQGLLG
ncbi:60S acidic ribosomal protein P0 [Heterocephalus glaber]|uniref:Large ribosomal subunit protein uL10 n=1 Tax=Heterocephalus glaber TaxID=10181 RepID=G5AUW6_HETGA|nr:60S acidic ribosomal protein P0 [Heterocephalus glaber]